jgi:transposase InsO family protein
MKHRRGAPYHPQTQGKIERWHQTLKNRILLENYFLPGDLEAQIEAFVDHYNVTTRLLPQFVGHDAFDHWRIAVLFDEELSHSSL